MKKSYKIISPDIWASCVGIDPEIWFWNAKLEIEIESLFEEEKKIKKRNSKENNITNILILLIFQFEAKVFLEFHHLKYL